MKIYIKDHKTIAQRGERETRTRKGKTRRKGKVRVDERTAREVGEEEEEEEEVGQEVEVEEEVWEEHWEEAIAFLCSYREPL